MVLEGLELQRMEGGEVGLERWEGGHCRKEMAEAWDDC